jgi:hypothetical protein
MTMRDLSSISDIREARHVSRDCPYCHGEGLATIYHADYDGWKPFVEVPGPNGTTFRRLTRTTAYCHCCAGQWIAETHRRESTEIFNRMNIMDEIINKYKRGLTLWFPEDPTAAYADDSEIPDWKSFREQLAAKPVVKTLPKPEPDGSRTEAYREMGLPGPNRREEPPAC